MNYKLENIPVPPRGRPGARGGNTKYPFEEMKVGQSFFFKGDAKAAHRVRSAAVHWNRKHPNLKVVVRRDGKGWRCGRPKPD